MKMDPEHILGYAEVNVGDKVFKIEFTNMAMITLQQKFGSMNDIAKEFVEFHVEGINEILFQGLRKHHQTEIDNGEITMETIHNLSYFSEFLPLVGGLSKAFGLAVPTEDNITDEMPDAMKKFAEEAKKKDSKKQGNTKKK
jgi:hypothetical protein